MLNPSIAAAAATALPPAGAAHARLSHRLAAAVPHSVLALLMRAAMAAIFFQSGRTKVSGFLTLTDSADPKFTRTVAGLRVLAEEQS